MKRLLFTILGLALSMSLPASALTSQPPPAKFKGRVVDPHVALIPKAAVVIEGAGKKWELETDEDGEDVGEINVELPAGTYRFTVGAPGFKKLVMEDFRVASGAKVAYEFRLEVRDCDDCEGLYPPGFPPSARRAAQQPI
ncbi:MAG: carboxypeptidase-like regulatory domain-containing protein [Pyrinomonadaceae bacterium]